MALLFLAAQVVDLAHRTRTEHVLCVEHGELEHTEQRAAHAALETDVVGAQWRPLEVPAETAHEHCGLVSLRRDLNQLQGCVPAVAWIPQEARPAALDVGDRIPELLSRRAESARGPPPVV